VLFSETSHQKKACGVRGMEMKLICTLLLSTVVVGLGMLFTGKTALCVERNAKPAVGLPSDPNKFHEICHHVLAAFRAGRRIGTNPTKVLALIADMNTVFKEYRFTDKAMSVFRDNEGYVATLSAIDCQDDGVDELLFSYTVGSQHCEDNYFFKKDSTGKYDYLEEVGIDATGGRLCSWGGTAFFRHKGRNYLYVYYNPEVSPPPLDLYSATPNGFHYECTVVKGPRKAITIMRDESLEPRR
jgi:hypothetical protein